MTSFTTGQLVWAKIKGKAWWPATVSHTNIPKNKNTDIEFEVNFVGETLSASVNHDNIADFDAKFNDYSKNKGKKFQEVLKTALEMAKNKNTSHEERSKSQKINKTSQPVEAPIKAAPVKRGRGRPRKNPEPESTVIVEIKPRTPSTHKEVKKSARKPKKAQEQKDNSHTMVVEEQRKEKEVSHDEIAVPAIPERITRSHLKKSKNSIILAEPLPPTARKGRQSTVKKENPEITPASVMTQPMVTPVRRGRNATASKDDKKSVGRKDQRESVNFKAIITQSEVTVQTSRKGRKATATKEEKKMEVVQEIPKEKEKFRPIPVIDIESRPIPLKSQIPLPEKFQARNLLISITAEPSAQSHIEVTTRKRHTRSMMKMKNPVASQAKSSIPMRRGPSMSQIENSNKRPSMMWYRGVPPSVYLTQDKMRNQRSIATDYIVKKVKGSPHFDDRMSSIKGTKLKDVQSDRNWISKAKVAYNSLMIKKFENDLEQLITKLVKRFKNGQMLHDTDDDHAKVLNIIVEFDRNKFNGSELTSSDIGKLLKTMQRLLMNNKSLLAEGGDMLVSMVAKILHKVKDSILRFCLDNSDYVESFGINEEMNRSPTRMDMIDIDTGNMQYDSNRMALDDSLDLSRSSFMEGANFNDRDRSKPIFLQQEHHKALYFSGQDKNALSELSLASNRGDSDKQVNFHSNFTTL